MTLDLVKLHDSDLRGHGAEGDEILRQRGLAASKVRVIVARMFGRGDMMTSSQWQVLPFVTETGTVGVVDVARGTAWDSGVAAPAEVEALGLEEQPYAAANGVGGDVRMNGELVQRDGATPGAPVKVPNGWRQIALPTWRGYTAGAGCYDDVPPEEFTPGMWIRPRLAAGGLVTCYGRPGVEKDWAFLARAHGRAYVWPWGLPPWVEGESLSVASTAVEAAGAPSLEIPRRSDEEEEQAARRMLELYRAETIRILRAVHRPGPQLGDTAKVVKDREAELAEVRDAADALDAGEPAFKTYARVRDLIVRAGNRCNHGNGWGDAGWALRVLAQAEAATNPWSVAKVLGSFGRALTRALGLDRPVSARALFARVRGPVAELLADTARHESPVAGGVPYRDLNHSVESATRLLAALDRDLGREDSELDGGDAWQIERIRSLCQYAHEIAPHTWEVRSVEEIRRLQVEHVEALLWGARP